MAIGVKAGGGELRRMGVEGDYRCFRGIGWVICMDCRFRGLELVISIDYRFRGIEWLISVVSLLDEIGARMKWAW